MKSCTGFQWLDEVAGYFWLQNGRRNLLRRRIRRVLSVAPRVAVSELRAALRRDHRSEGCIPPTRVLLEFCKQIPETRVQGNDVVARNPEHPRDIIRGDERIIVELLLEYGPVCQREKLQLLATNAGVGRPSFWQCLSFRPTITRYARGVYGLTGAKVLPGEIKSLIPAIRSTDVLQDHGWTKDGRVWIAYRLSDNALETGVLGVPGAKRAYIQGEFDLQVVSGSVAGTLVVKGSSTWGIGTFLRSSGAEAGDILILEISQRD